jgi:uncharacterized membrane-anchored protein
MATAHTCAHPRASSSTRALLNKVPEATLWFWVIKTLYTTVGESFADGISVDLGVGLVNTALMFTGWPCGRADLDAVLRFRGLTRVVPAAVLFWQMRLPKYNLAVLVDGRRPQ